MTDCLQFNLEKIKSNLFNMNHLLKINTKDKNNDTMNSHALNVPDNVYNNMRPP